MLLNSKELHKGDINAAVKKVQSITGVMIDPSWWDANVGNDGTAEDILARFDEAYGRLVETNTK